MGCQCARKSEWAAPSDLSLAAPIWAVFLNRDGGRVRCTWTDGTKRISQVFDLDDIEQTPEL